ncbi:ninjurin-2-like [Macrobrachium nipponense]|uniref:ninjurin-2-like n=1 Tax=Macrobrachium nipponense TaxID=159736 RepID=UPI0030C800E8
MHTTLDVSIPLGRPMNTEAGHGTRKPVDLNVMKRNMSVAKGFMDISLISANANQLKNLLNNGDTSSASYYFVFTGIIASLAIQITTGVLLIVNERFNINDEDDKEWCDRLNDISVCLIFLVVVINVFVSSFGVSVHHPSESYEKY